MAIVITTHSTAESLVGQSHWWGAPDLPEHVPYPFVMVGEGEEAYAEPLTFVCQIRLADIAPLDPDGFLPHEGMLYFFAPLDYFLGELNAPLDYHTPPAVLYASPEEELRPYKLCWEGTGESVFRPAEAMTYRLSEENSGDGHLLLSRPYQEEVTDAHPDSLSLLQIDEDDRWGLRFYDCGMYYFLMPESALTAREWDRVEGEMFFY